MGLYFQYVSVGCLFVTRKCTEFLNFYSKLVIKYLHQISKVLLLQQTNEVWNLYIFFPFQVLLWIVQLRDWLKQAGSSTFYCLLTYISFTAVIGSLIPNYFESLLTPKQCGNIHYVAHASFKSCVHLFLWFFSIAYQVLRVSRKAALLASCIKHFTSAGWWSLQFKQNCGIWFWWNSCQNICEEV